MKELELQATPILDLPGVYEVRPALPCCRHRVATHITPAPGESPEDHFDRVAAEFCDVLHSQFEDITPGTYKKKASYKNPPENLETIEAKLARLEDELASAKAEIAKQKGQ